LFDAGLQPFCPVVSCALPRAGQASIAFGDEVRRDVDAARSAVTLLQPVSADAQRRVR
jgi:hypothetical protein